MKTKYFCPGLALEGGNAKHRLASTQKLGIDFLLAVLYNIEKGMGCSCSSTTYPYIFLRGGEKDGREN